MFEHSFFCMDLIVDFIVALLFLGSCGCCCSLIPWSFSLLLGNAIVIAMLEPSLFSGSFVCDWWWWFSTVVFLIQQKSIHSPSVCLVIFAAVAFLIVLFFFGRKSQIHQVDCFLLLLLVLFGKRGRIGCFDIKRIDDAMQGIFFCGCGEWCGKWHIFWFRFFVLFEKIALRSVAGYISLCFLFREMRAVVDGT